MYKIQSLGALEVLDSRGTPTIEVTVFLEKGVYGRAIIPSGASTGSFEAHEQRDGDPKRYFGKGVLKAIHAVTTEMTSHVCQKSFHSQEELDQTLIDLDGTENKSRLGANALLGVSLAFAHACAAADNKPLFQFLGGNAATLLPRPMINIINGGAHADNELDIQEFMIVPVRANSFCEAVRVSAEVFYNLKKILKQKGLNTNVGDEGGFAPHLRSSIEALDCLCEATHSAGYTVGHDIQFALDSAANEFFKDNFYHFEGKKYNAAQMIQVYEDLCNAYPICSLEDGLQENDVEGWVDLTAALGGRIQIVGDDLFVTNPKRLEKGIAVKAANAILIKPNQIGTLTQTLQTISIAKEAGYKVIISHRSGETEDTTIADLSVATNAGQIKTGSLSRTDRIAKYNQLMRIEKQLGEKARF